MKQKNHHSNEDDHTNDGDDDRGVGAIAFTGMITRRLTLVTLKKKKISSPTSYTY
jgi:hypothetical protein